MASLVLRCGFAEQLLEFDDLYLQAPYPMLTIVDEHTRECLSIDVARRPTSEDVVEPLSDLFVRRGVPVYIRSDNGPELTATAKEY